MRNLIRSLAAIGLAAVVAAPGAALSQDYPNKPIKMIVPFGPGGGGDQLVLSFVDELSKKLGQPIVKENHPGANSIIGTNLLAKAEPDGYTLGVVTTGFSANPFLYKEIPFDSEKDFAPVTVVAAYPFSFAVRADFPAQTVEELVAYGKANPGKITSANSGRGSGAEFSTGLLSALAGIEIKSISYKGGGPAMTAVAGGFCDLIFTNLSGSLPFAQAGKVRLLGHTGTKPFSDPPLQPIADQGVPGYEFAQWWGILAPAGTPPEVLNTFHAALKDVFEDPAVRARMEKVNAEIILNTPDEAKSYIQAQAVKSKQIADALGLKPE